MDTVLVYPDEVPTGSTPIFRGRFLDGTEPVTLNNLRILTLSLLDATTRQTLFGVAAEDGFFSNRVYVNSAGHVTVALHSADTKKLTPFATEWRAVMLCWAAVRSDGRTVAGIREVRFPIIAGDTR